MSTHKLRPKLKKYIRLGLLKKKGAAVSKKQNFFFSPDLNYLNTKFSNKLEHSFNKAISNHRKLKLFFGFHKTSLLKRVIKKKLLKNLKSRYFLKEVEFCSILECRLDILLYRLGLVSTIFEAKQLISHKKVRVNNNYVSSYSYLLKKSDVISFEPSVHTLLKKRLLKHLQERNLYILNFVEINFKILKVIFIKEKFFIPEHLQHYNSLLKWKI